MSNQYPNDPTSDWVWDPERNRFLKPSLFMEGMWGEARPPIFELDNPVYQFDPKRHRIYQDVIREQEEKEARAEAAKKQQQQDSIPAPTRQPEAKEKNPTMSGYFDGRMFTIRNQVGDVIYRESYPAVSGKKNKNGEFDYSPQRQQIPNVGPIPEGTYWINPQRIIKSPSFFSPKNIGNMLGGISPRKFGSMAGGTPSWGAGHVSINPNEVDVNGTKRSGFTIHGGWIPGSAGCIDLNSQDESFFKFLEKHRSTQDSIPIFVKYPEIEE